MKRKILLTTALVLAMNSFAYDFKVDGIFYNITSSIDLTCSVTYETNSFNSYSGNISIPSSVTYNGKSYSVTSIGSFAFSSCSSLTSVTIPMSVTSIGNDAFRNCSSLTSVNIPESVISIGGSAFSSCSSLTSVNIPGSVTSISDTFSGCNSLTSVTISEGVTGIGAYAFSGCSSLTSVTIPSSVTTIENIAFQGCSSLTSFNVDEHNLNYSSFEGILYDKGCRTLIQCPGGKEVVVIPNFVTTIGDGAFRYCNNLTSVTIPSSVTTIGVNAFTHLTNLTSITIPSSVTSIGDYAFYNSSLKTIVIEDSKVGISAGDMCFGDCYRLESVYLGRIFSYENANFFGPFINSHFKNVTIGKNVETIGNSLFRSSQITTISIPSNVKTIGNDALPASLKKVVIEDSDKPLTLGFVSNNINIGSPYSPVYKDYHYGLFKNCSLDSLYLGRDLTFTTREFKEEYPGCGAPFENITSLRSIVVSDKVTKLDNNLFAGCTGLESIDLKDAETTLSIGVQNLSASSKTSMFKNANLKDLYLGRNIAYQINNSWNSEYSLAPFANQDSLKNVTIGNDVTILNDYLFYSCDTLANVIFPAGLTKIGKKAFEDCKQIERISIPANVDSIKSGAFASCKNLKEVIIEDGEKELSWSSPLSYSPVETIYIGRNLTYTGGSTSPLGNYSGGADALRSAVFGNKVNAVGDYMFYSCDSLKSVTLPESITAIGKYAFAYCSKLESVKIPQNVSSIGDYAFCRSVHNISIPKSVLSIGEYVFNEQYYTPYELKELTIEDGSTPLTLGRSLFSNCALKSVYIGRDLEYTIKEENRYDQTYYGAPFEYNETLKSVVFGDSVTTIKEYTFWNCSNLKSVKTGESLSKLEPNCFSSTLDTIFFKISTPPSGTSLGVYSKKLIAFVPKGTAATWRNNYYWKSQIIIDEDEEILFVELTEPGSLASKIIEKGTLPANVAKLKIKGELNDTDWGILKPSSMGQLYYLDLSEVTNDSIPTKQFQNTYSYSTNVSIKDVVFQKTLKRIGDYAFDYCHRLSGDLVLPQTIERIGACAMRGTSFSSIVLPDKEIIAVVDSSAFDRYVGSSSLPVSASTETVWIGKNWKIGTTAFRSNTALKDVSIGRNAKIGEQAFANCNALNTLKLSENTSIGNKAFYGNSSLVALNIPGNGTTMGNNAFESCYNLEKVQFEEGLLSIGDYAFNNCNKITGDIQFPSSLQFIGERAFYYAKLIENISFGDNLEIIGNYAFYNCTGLKSIKMGQSIENIGDNAFYGCEQIESLELPLNLRTLGNYAFYGCKKLKELEIHSKIESFGQNNGSFLGCDSIAKVTSHQRTPVGFIYNTFNNNVYKNAELYVPKNSSGNYLLADGWKNFINFNEFEDSEVTETTQIAIINSDGTDATLYVKAGDDVKIQDGIQRLFVTRNIPLKTISYTRTFNNTNWQALYVPFDIPVTAEFLEKFEVAYINNVHQYDDDDDGSLDRTIVEFFKMKSGTLKANYPYVIRARQTGTQTIIVNDATLYATAENSVDCRSTQFEYMFKGIYSRQTADELEGCYALSGGEWKPIASGAYLNACRVYLRITPRQSGLKPLKSIGMRFVDDDATEIDAQSVNEDSRMEEIDVFDLAGRKVENPTQGIYIVNGKKVVIK